MKKTQAVGMAVLVVALTSAAVGYTVVNGAKEDPKPRTENVTTSVTGNAAIENVTTSATGNAAIQESEQHPHAEGENHPHPEGGCEHPEGGCKHPEGGCKHPEGGCKGHQPGK